MSEESQLPKWSVNVCRTGFGHATFEVHAATEKEALLAADDEAGDHIFSENSSEYSFPNGATQLTGEPVTSINSEDGVFAHTEPACCPVCQSDELTSKNDCDDTGYIIRKVTCDDCGSHWCETFDFSMATDLVRKTPVGD